MTQAINLTVTRTTDVEITVRRRFAAPPSKVFEALTTPNQQRQWMSAAGRELIECNVDLRPGGRYRYVFKAPKGSTFGMYGTYREVAQARPLVHTEAYDGYDWEPLVTTTDLIEDAAGWDRDGHDHSLGDDVEQRTDRGDTPQHRRRRNDVADAEAGGEDFRERPDVHDEPRMIRAR